METEQLRRWVERSQMALEGRILMDVLTPLERTMTIHFHKAKSLWTSCGRRIKGSAMKLTQAVENVTCLQCWKAYEYRYELKESKRRAV